MPATKKKSTLPTRQLETKTIRTKKGPDKEYVQVDERLKYYRETYGMDLRLISTIVHLTDDVCVFKAEVIDHDGIIYATGHAREVRTDSNSFVNATSYVENCETSAWGRALANFGIGIDNGIASAHEVVNAINQRAQQTQQAPPQQYTQQQWKHPQAAPVPVQQPAQNVAAPQAAPQQHHATSGGNVDQWIAEVNSINDPNQLKNYVVQKQRELQSDPSLYTEFQTKVVNIAMERNKQLTQS